MRKRKLHEVWKEFTEWKVQCPNGRLTFRTKKEAEDYARDVKNLIISIKEKI